MALCTASGVFAQTDCVLGAPCYSEAGVVNAASYQAGAFAPNTIVSLFGTGLSFATSGIRPEDLLGGVLPIELPGTGVHVLLNGLFAHIYYVSPTQVNLLVPSNFRAGRWRLQLVREGTAGPAVWVELLEAAPGLFLLEPGVAVATHADFSAVTQDAPARPGEIVVLWATGLGPTVPRADYGQVLKEAAWIERIADFRVLLNGTSVPPGNVLYAGVAPYFAGLYQINLRLPDTVAPDPEVRLAVGDAISPAGVRLFVRPAGSQP